MKLKYNLSMSLFKKIGALFYKNDSEYAESTAIIDKWSKQMGLGGEQHKELANIVCIRSNGKLSFENAFDLVSKNKMRILLKRRRNASREEILGIANFIRVDFPHLSKEESESILELLI